MINIVFIKLCIIPYLGMSQRKLVGNYGKLCCVKLVL